MNKTDKVNYNATMRFADDAINFSNPTRLRKESSMNALGLLTKICLKTSARVSDILHIKYSDFIENKIHQGTYTLTYEIRKTKSKNTVPIGRELMNDILQYKEKCINRHNTANDMIFFNYQSKSLFTRVWASKNIAQANREGLLGKVVNVAGTHSLRKTAANEIFDKTQDLKLAKEFLGHKNILTTSIYLQDSFASTQDKLRELLCH